MRNLINQVERILTEDYVIGTTSNIIDSVIFMDFLCNTDKSNYLIYKLDNLLKKEINSKYELNISDDFSDGTSFCTLKININ